VQVIRGINFFFYLVLTFSLSISSVKAQWDHEVGLELRYFFDKPQFSEQGEHAATVFYKPTWSTVSGDSVFDFSAVARFDENDEERSLLDISELSWLYTYEDWEFKAGISKVFWGVAETQRLVDVINQTDLADDINGESKLGQPLVNVTKLTDYGIFEGYLLPYFRERTFPGEKGRLRTEPIVNGDLSEYESDDEETHLDVALRWSNTFNIFDFGVTYFNGTARDPVFSLSEDQQFLIPTYVQIEQVGLDMQATYDAWLFKLEAVDRQSSEVYQSQTYQAAIAGLEYTIFDLALSGADLGLVMEYSYDSRGEESFSDDLGFVGLRLALNDEQSSDLFIGCTANGQLCTAEGSRRLGESMKVSLRANSFSGIETESALASQSQDDFLQFSLSYFF